MNMTNSETHVRQLARLARLSISDEEEERYTKQLADILAYVSRLQEVQTTAPAVLSESLGQPSPWRTGKEGHACPPELRTALLEAFPHREGDVLQVQAVFTKRV